MAAPCLPPSVARDRAGVHSRAKSDIDEKHAFARFFSFGLSYGASAMPLSRRHGAGPVPVSSGGTEIAKPAAVEILNCLADFLLRVHHELAIANHRLVDALTALQQYLRVR